MILFIVICIGILNFETVDSYVNDKLIHTTLEYTEH